MSQTLAPVLTVAVWMRVDEIKRLEYVPDYLRASCDGLIEDIANRGDTLLYGGKKGEAASIFNKLALAIAILSFNPGGIEIFGTKFESKFD